MFKYYSTDSMITELDLKFAHQCRCTLLFSSFYAALCYLLNSQLFKYNYNNILMFPKTMLFGLCFLFPIGNSGIVTRRYTGPLVQHGLLPLRHTLFTPMQPA